MTPSSASVTSGSTKQFTATGTYSDSSTQNITSSVTWNSSNTSVATINSSGLATGVDAGTTNITASLSGITSSARVLTIFTATLQSITVTPSSAGIASGSTKQFTATGTYSDSSTQNITNSVTWNSSNTSVATINGSGLATGVNAGTTNITASLTPYTSSARALTVTATQYSSTGVSSSSSSTGTMKSSSSSSSSTGNNPAAPNPIAHEIVKSGTTNMPLVFSAEDFISNFSDTPGNNLMKIKITSLPDYGTLKLSKNNIAVNQEIAVGDLGNLTYVPEASWNGSDSFSWNGSDGILYGNSNADVTITIDQVITPSFCTDHALICYVIPPILSATAIIIGVLKYTHKNNLWCFKKAASAPSGVQLERHIP